MQGFESEEVTRVPDEDFCWVGCEGECGRWFDEQRWEVCSGLEKRLDKDYEDAKTGVIISFTLVTCNHK